MNSGQGGPGPAFKVIGMGRGLQDDLVAGLGMGFDGQLVGHGPGGDQEGLLFAEKRRHFFLEGVDRRIFPKDVVAHFGLGHGPAHRGRRFSDGIASQIDKLSHGFSFPVSRSVKLFRFS